MSLNECNSLKYERIELKLLSIEKQIIDQNNKIKVIEETIHLNSNTKINEKMNLLNKNQQDINSELFTLKEKLNDLFSNKDQAKDFKHQIFQFKSEVSNEIKSNFKYQNDLRVTVEDFIEALTKEKREKNEYLVKKFQEIDQKLFNINNRIVNTRKEADTDVGTIYFGQRKVEQLEENFNNFKNESRKSFLNTGVEIDEKFNSFNHTLKNIKASFNSTH